MAIGQTFVSLFSCMHAFSSESIPFVFLIWQYSNSLLHTENEQPLSMYFWYHMSRWLVATSS